MGWGGVGGEAWGQGPSCPAPPLCPVLCYVLSRLVCLKSHPQLLVGGQLTSEYRCFERLSDMPKFTQSGRAEI